MEPYVTVAVFMLPTELAVARGLLESEGIPCRTLDEFTVQVHNLYSQAIGGVKLQVPEADAGRAKALLREGGFISDGIPEEDRFWPKVVHWTDGIPLLRRIELPIARIMVLAALAMLVLVVPIALASRPSATELLTDGTWCVESVVHDGEALQPNSVAPPGYFMLDDTGYEGCEETLWFHSTGEVRVPGFGTPSRQGNWTVDRGRLWIDVTGGPDRVYEGPFAIAVDRHYLTLRSQRTTIHCTRLRLLW